MAVATHKMELIQRPSPGFVFREGHEAARRQTRVLLTGTATDIEAVRKWIRELPPRVEGFEITAKTTADLERQVQALSDRGGRVDLPHDRLYRAVRVTRIAG